MKKKCGLEDTGINVSKGEIYKDIHTQKKQDSETAYFRQ